VFDYDPNAPVNWVGEAIKLDLVPCVRVQECNGGCTPDPGYAAGVAQQIINWKLLNPQYADRIVCMALWNEPGDPRDYVPMTVYADYLVEAYSLIHQSEADAAAANPGLGLEGTFKVMTPGQNGPAGWNEAFNHNPQAKFSFDIWATHPYPEATPPWHNVHDGDVPGNTTKCIDSYIQDLDEIAKTHQGVPGRRGFPVMITETAYGDHLGISYEGWPKTNRQMAADYNVDAFFTRWYQWPEIIAVHPYILNNWSWDHFAWVQKISGSVDVEAPFGVREPTHPYPQYTAVKAERESLEAQGLLAPAALTPYRGAVGSIAGSITRNDTGAAVPYATIYTDGYEYGHVSLYDGLYEVHDVPVGTYTLSVQKWGYAGASQTITVSENQTTTANFSVTYLGKVQHQLYWVDTWNGDPTCNGIPACDNLNRTYHTQSFKTGPDTGFIKFASCKPAWDGITMKFTILAGGPSGTQVGDPAYGTLEPGVGGNMIGAEWPDGQEPAVQPNTTYWLRFEDQTGASTYCYASDNSNPYPDGNADVDGNVDYFGYIQGMTQLVNTVTGTISGNVKDDSNNPISGASVSTSPGGQGATTDASGNYTISDVPVGSTNVVASKSGYSSETVTGVTVSENQTTTVNFVLEAGPTTGTVSGTITDGTNGGGLSGATVETTSGGYTTTSDANGNYTLSNVTPGTYTVQASKSSYMTEQQTGVQVSAGYVTDVGLALSEEAPFGGIVNGNMEGGAFNDPNGDHRTANDWHQYTLSGFSKSNVTWLGGNAHSADWVQDFWEGGYTSGIYQQAPNADVGNDFTGTAWVKASASTMKFTIGLDPSGGTDPTAGNLVWSDDVVPGTTWTQISVTAQATSSTITLFIEAENPSAANQNAFIDDAALADDGPGGPPTAPSISLSVSSLSNSCDEGTDASSQSFDVWNSGAGTLDYAIAASHSWMSVSPSTGTSTGEADTITVTYDTDALAAGSYTGTITVSDNEANNSPQVIDVDLTVNGVGGGGPTVSEAFTTMPSWSSEYNAGWGSAATFAIVAGGESGNALQAQRSSDGSSCRVKVYDIDANTDYTISVYVRCPNHSIGYWAECAYRLGSHSGSDFDGNSGAWTMVKKFDYWGVNGNGDTWTQYSANFNSGGSTQISVGFKLGSSGGAGPTVKWDTLEIAE
jgi:hypothetical protein